jgi:uncharacterized membrane protein YdbT with pleckstrin-like domain
MSYAGQADAHLNITEKLNVSYINENLITGETIVYRTGLHWIVLLGPGVLCGICILLGTFFLIGGGGWWPVLLTWVFGALVIGGAIIKRNATEMAVTNKRVVVKVGFLQRKTIELFLSKVESVGVEQGLFERMIGCGSIVVRGTGGTHEPFKMVRSPLEFRRRVQQHSEDLTTS